MRAFPSLSNNETILWEGKPDTKLRFGMETMATGIFAVALILACFGLATVIDRSYPGSFWPILAPGFVIGAAAVLVLPLIDSAKRRKTAYRLTSHNAYIAGPKQSNDSTPIPPLDDLIYRDGTPPSIYFARRPVQGQRGKYADIGFERIAEARDVFILMRERAAELHQ